MGSERVTHDDCSQNAFETFTLLVNGFVTLQNANDVRTENTFVSVQLTQFLVQPLGESGRHFWYQQSLQKNEIEHRIFFIGISFSWHWQLNRMQYDSLCVPTKNEFDNIYTSSFSILRSLFERFKKMKIKLETFKNYRLYRYYIWVDSSKKSKMNSTPRIFTSILNNSIPNNIVWFMSNLVFHVVRASDMRLSNAQFRQRILQCVMDNFRWISYDVSSPRALAVC